MLGRGNVVDQRSPVVEIGELFVADLLARPIGPVTLDALIVAIGPELGTDGRAFAVPADIKRQDRDVLGLKFLSQVLPAVLVAAAAQGMQHDRAGGLVALGAGIKAAVTLYHI